jgi:DNA polymerase-3 subunit epsilon
MGMNVLEAPLVLVDIETNGLSYTRGRIIEVAAIRVENGQITDSFSTLVDPQTELPFFISDLTGITSKDLQDAPTFYDVAERLYDILDGAVFVAHNVRFDYSFIKNEFKRVGRQFSPKLLCTVRLSKALYPQHHGHKLQNLIDRCGLVVENRHRAYDDAEAVRQFLEHVQAKFDTESLAAAIKLQLRTPSMPKGLAPAVVSQLPDSPGVYIFEDETGSPLYIGKSVNIRKRVMSHFGRDHEIESEFKMSQGVVNIEAISTNGELEALLLESQLIKERQPLHNKKLRRTQKLTLARKSVNTDGFIAVSIEDIDKITPEDTEDILAVYSTKGRAKEFLNQIIKDYGLCPKLFGFEKSKGACFSYQLKRCDGACAGKITPEVYNARLLDIFEDKRIHSWPFGSPVVIEEKAPEAAVKKSFIIDQWCVIAQVESTEDYTPNVSFYEKAFDIDTYKILRSYLRDKKYKLSIKPITRADITKLATA